ncbi:MAG: acyl-CoA dehydratase activase [Deltaproteobacteria bacterium]|jgi:predicted CoA-substrate-specific enzyme activase|nr:acyl-CoA dehydratase activase [Deltaproteobacteria bacterium]
MLTLGIDIGSASSKAVILADGQTIVSQRVIQAGTGSSGPQRVLDAVFKKSGFSWDDFDNSVVTGYGRFSIEEVKNQVSEITCHAKGVAFLVPGVHTIIDIGGQDVKAISLDDRGFISKFFMNDKCAAGTGRFLEVMSRVLELDLSAMGDLHFQSRHPAQVSSTCTVFAESEIISLLSKGTPKEDIVAGVHYSTAVKAVALANRVGLRDEVVMCGGVASNRGVVDAISKSLNRKVSIAPLAQLSGALGAALIAAEEVRRRKDAGRTSAAETQGNHAPV